MARERSRANIEAKAAFQKGIDAEISRAISKLEGSIHRFIEGESYPKLLAKLAKDSYKLLGSGCIIEVGKGDDKRFKAPSGCTVKTNDGIKGGLIAYSKDGKRYVDYTIDRMLERVRGKLVKRYTELIE